MDLQLIRREMSVFRDVLAEQAEQAIDLEFTLPDYCPKIEKIIKSTLTPRIGNVSYSGSTITAEGEAELNLLYCSSEQPGLFGYETAMQFSKSTDCKYDCDKMMITANVAPGYVNCRAVNERKLDVHGSVMLHFKGVQNDVFDVVVGSECSSLQLKRAKTENLENCGYASKQFILQQDFYLPQTSGSIENIIRTSGEVSVSDCKFLADKAIVKGELDLNILYRNASGECETFFGSVPIEEIADIEGVDEHCYKNVQIMLCSLKIKPFTDANGECRSMQAEAKINIDLAGSRINELEPVCDCYSVTNNLDVQRQSLNIKTAPQQLSASHQMREMIELGTAIGSIIDVSCDCGSIAAAFEDRTMTVRGIVTATIIAKDSDGNCVCYEKKLPFSHEFEIEPCADHTADIKAIITGCSYSMKSDDSIELRAQIDITGLVCCKKQMNVITDITADDNSEKQIGDMPAIVLYFAKPQESVWDIAMRYNTSVDLIMGANGLDNDILATDTVLLIPGV